MVIDGKDEIKNNLFWLVNSCHFFLLDCSSPVCFYIFHFFYFLILSFSVCSWFLFALFLYLLCYHVLMSLVIFLPLFFLCIKHFISIITMCILFYSSSGSIFIICIFRTFMLVTTTFCPKCNLLYKFIDFIVFIC